MTGGIFSFLSRNRVRVFLSCSVIFFSILATYYPSVNNGFVFDDHYQIEWNSHFTSWSTSSVFTEGVWDSTSCKFDGSMYYRPLLHVSLYILFLLFGSDPYMFHLAGILLHAGVAITLFLVLLHFYQNGFLRSLFPNQRSPYIPLTAAALIFSLHPLNAEVVLWSSTIPEMLLALFLLLSIFFYLSASGKWNIYHLASVLCFFVALLFKETAATFLLLISTLSIFSRHPETSRINAFFTWARKDFLFITVLVVYAMMHLLSVSETLKITDFSAFLLSIILLVPAQITHYALTIVAPIELRFLKIPYFLIPQQALPGVALFFSASILSVVLIMKKVVRPSRETLFLFLWTFLFLLPSLNPMLGVFALSDRYYYVPSLGLSVLIASLIFRAFGYMHMRKVAVIAIAILLAWYSSVDRKQIPIWENDENLLQNTMRLYPGYDLPYLFLAGIQCDRDNLARCKELYEESIDKPIKAGDKNMIADAMEFDIAEYHWRNGDPKTSLEHFSRVSESSSCYRYAQDRIKDSAAPQE
jgi:hypothetical protein